MKLPDPAGHVTRQLVDTDRTVLVRMWSNGNVDVATRPDSDAIWGPPVAVDLEAAYTRRGQAA